jgi:hypothetical protein
VAIADHECDVITGIMIDDGDGHGLVMDGMAAVMTGEA